MLFINKIKKGIPGVTQYPFITNWLLIPIPRINLTNTGKSMFKNPYGNIIRLML